MKDGTVIGEGWHLRAGEDHAEVMALRRAGATAMGSTLYVTLEPCNHHGRTPPCTDALLNAGVSRVVIGHLDPNPKMCGKSVDLLRDVGVEVEVLDAPELERQNEQFFRTMRTGRPFVHLKLASTLDGRIAAPGGDSKWITGEETRSRAHMLRAEAGAVLVGARTARVDDPLLTARGVPDSPRITRAVLDPGLTISPASQLVETAADSPVLIFSYAGADRRRVEELERMGVEVIEVPRKDGDLDLEFVLDELGHRGERGLLVEGGGETAGRFLAAGLVDKLTIFYAPRLIGADGIPMVGALNVATMEEALQFYLEDVERIGEDVMLTFYPREGYVHRDS